MFKSKNRPIPYGLLVTVNRRTAIVLETSSSDIRHKIRREDSEGWRQEIPFCG
jgi:hypothetical protein